MTNQDARARLFFSLHRGDEPLLLPNPWDVGSAKVMEHLGFDAVATTSAGHAHTLGRLDGAVSREEALAHAAEIVAAVDVPVSADFENGFADDPDGVAESVRLAAETGLAGLSIEDWSGTEIYDTDLAVERVAAAVDAAPGLVITARCENFLRGNPDFDDTLARLQSYQVAGASVLYAPFMSEGELIGRLVESVDLPVNVLAQPDAPSLRELAELGVARISVGSGIYLAALAVLGDIGAQFLETGGYDFAAAGRGVELRDRSFG